VADFITQATGLHDFQNALDGGVFNQIRRYIASWIKIRRIEILNVAGPWASEDQQIYS